MQALRRIVTPVIQWNTTALPIPAMWLQDFPEPALNAIRPLPGPEQSSLIQDSRFTAEHMQEDGQPAAIATRIQIIILCFHVLPVMHTINRIWTANIAAERTMYITAPTAMHAIQPAGQIRRS